MTNLTLRAWADRSMSVTFTSAGMIDELTFADLSGVLPAAASSSAIKAFLDAARGGISQTLVAIAANGVSFSFAGTNTVAASSIQVTADKTLEGFSAGDWAFRLSLSSTIAS